VIVEGMFLIDLILSFITSINDPASPKLKPPITDLVTIASTFIKGDFTYQFIPLIPFQYLDLGGGR